jgi:hypothetical protein
VLSTPQPKTAFDLPNKTKNEFMSIFVEEPLRAWRNLEYIDPTNRKVPTEGQWIELPNDHGQILLTYLPRPREDGMQIGCTQYELYRAERQVSGMFHVRYRTSRHFEVKYRIQLGYRTVVKDGETRLAVQMRRSYQMFSTPLQIKTQLEEQWYAFGDGWPAKGHWGRS